MKFVLGFVAITSMVQCGVSTDSTTNNTQAAKAEQQGLAVALGDAKTMDLNYGSLWPEAIRNDEDIQLLEEVLEEIEKGFATSINPNVT